MNQNQPLQPQVEEKTPLDIGLAAFGIWIPQSLGLAFLYSFYTIPFSRAYGDRAFLTATFEAVRGAILNTPAAYGQALEVVPFNTVLIATGLLGFNALHQWKREPRELTLISMLAFVGAFFFIFYQRLG